MADATVSALVEMLLTFTAEKIGNEIQLVRSVKKELLNLRDKLNAIRNVLDDADKRQFTDKGVKDWLWRLEQTSYEMEDILEEWTYAELKHKKESESSTPEQKVCPFIPYPCLCYEKVSVRRNIAKKILNLKSRIDEILIEIDILKFVTVEPKTGVDSGQTPTESSDDDLAKVQGQRHYADVLARKLTANEGSHKGLGYRVLSILGGGGLGKTTLAQLVYNDSRVKKCFDFRIWLCVPDPFDVFAIAEGIIEKIQKEMPPINKIPMVSSRHPVKFDNLIQDLIGCISGKKILLVLDDVWNEEAGKWKPLKKALRSMGANSKVLVTTRKEQVNQVMGIGDDDIHSLDPLSPEDCWLVLSHWAFSGEEERDFKCFEEIGKEIAKKCNGSPLAANTLGSYLKSKGIEEWKNVLKSEVWGLELMEERLSPHLVLSYRELSPMLKRCFSYCAIFAKEKDIQVEQLIRIWMALGYLGSDICNAGGSSDNCYAGGRGSMESKGREYFNDLAMRSLFHDCQKNDSGKQIMSCKMHDMVHSFAYFLRKNVKEEAPGMTKRSCDCEDSLVSQVQKYHSLFWGKETPPNNCDCLRSLRVLGFDRKLECTPQGMENLIHLRWLDISGTKLSHDVLKSICKLYFLQTLLLASCSLEEVPREIGNLVQLRHLHLKSNRELKELPKSIFELLELQTLDIESCWKLSELPEDIQMLKNLKHLFIEQTREGLRLGFPKGLGELNGLVTLSEFHGGSGSNKLVLLKNLNNLAGSLKLYIKFNSTRDLEELVEDAREAELKKKECIHALDVQFNDDRDGNEPSSSLWLDLIDALQPSSNLENLKIWRYMGSTLPKWISSTENYLKFIFLSDLRHLSSLPPMGKLLFLEGLEMSGLQALKSVGGEWLGIGEREGDISSSSSSSSSSSLVAFPKLKELRFDKCPKWEKWEDITAQEEEFTRVMPCLTKLKIHKCGGLKMLPHGLLRKAAGCLRVLDISSSRELCKCYGDKDGSHWRSISENNPQLRLQMD